MNVANAHQTILHKFDVVLQYNPSDDIRCLKTQYLTGAVLYLANYYQSGTGSDEYFGYLSSHNIVGQLNSSLRSATPRSAVETRTIYDALSVMISCHISPIDTHICEDCNVEMSPNEESGLLLCPECGAIRELEGQIEEEKDNIKNTSYVPSQHCKFWIKHIFGLEHTEIPEHVVDGIHRIIERNGLKSRITQIPTTQYRAFLKELGATKYNSNITKIRKIVSGVGPPPPSDARYDLICRYFDLADEAFFNNLPENKTNRSYYPHFLYKIIEIVYADASKKRTRILQCIHLQSHDTLVANDDIWRKVCDSVGEPLIFIATKERR
jgi:hypothetical protein